MFLKNSDDGFKYFIGYLHDDDDVIRTLCIILPQMSGYIKYFDNGRKNMSFKIEDESVYLKYTEIWNKIKNSPNSKFYSQPIYDKYIKTKVKTFSSMINTLFSGNEIPKERNHYICIASICIDSVLRVDKKNYPQVYLEQCKYKIKKSLLMLKWILIQMIHMILNDYNSLLAVMSLTFIQCRDFYAV